MSKVSIELSASARNGVSRILQSIANSRQSDCELLSCLGLKIVPKEYQSIDKSRVEALLVMSKSWMSRIDTVDDLFHDEISGQKEKLGY